MAFEVEDVAGLFSLSQLGGLDQGCPEVTSVPETMNEDGQRTALFADAAESRWLAVDRVQLEIGSSLLI